MPDSGTSDLSFLLRCRLTRFLRLLLVRGVLQGPMALIAALGAMQLTGPVLAVEQLFLAAA